MDNKIKLDYICSSETIKIGKIQYFDIKNEIERINYFCLGISKLGGVFGDTNNI